MEVDVPLSYGVKDIAYPSDPKATHKVSFTWESQRAAAIFIKINAISTEFAERKHGGEKGAPFRLTIETHPVHATDQMDIKNLHIANCQVKVFKPRGSDRKHKADVEKLAKRSLQERSM